ncbi:MAG TPA: pilus assembly protein [Firmicutes bacterium]|nr:pilus assembly protein [Bacillota bacterium]
MPCNQFKANEKGQSLVEFALLLPILLLLLLGIIQFGIIFNGQITVTSAAREGARLAAVGADDEQVKDRVEEAAVALLLNIDRDEININRAVDGDEGKLSVRVNGKVDIIMPLLGIYTGESFTLSSESIMRLEIKP